LAIRKQRATKPGKNLDDFIDDTSLFYASANWYSWKDDYKSKKIAGTPLLNSKRRFARFCKEYSVHRTIKENKQDEFRKYLKRVIAPIVGDHSGRKLDDFECKSRSRFGSRGSKGKMLSVFSKVATFVRPEVFFAWDRYARAGLKIGLSPRSSGEFDSYEAYLESVNDLWKSAGERLIRSHFKRTEFNPPSRTSPALMRRVFDVALMRLGGRKYEPINWQKKFFRV
jgi:hypothetical protein